MVSYLGSYVIVAALVLPGGGLQHVEPQTRFDLVACQKTAHEINQRWLKESVVGFATCNLAEDDRTRSPAR